MLGFGTKSDIGYCISSSFFCCWLALPLFFFCQFSVVTVAMRVLVSWFFSCVLGCVEALTSVGDVKTNHEAEKHKLKTCCLQ
jgi:hypothetical protein